MPVQSRAPLILTHKIVSTEDKLLLKDYKAHKEILTKRANPTNLRMTVPKLSTGKSEMNDKIRAPDN